jgi:hypothetical protein
VRAAFIDHVTILIRGYARARLSARIIAHRALPSRRSFRQRGLQLRAVGTATTRPKLGRVTKYWEEVVKNKLALLFRRFVLRERNVGANRERDNNGDSELQFEWPYVMSSPIPILGPIARGSWVWHRHHKHSHHGFYRTRR